MPNTKRTLVFSITYNGYHGVYDRNIDSHKRYADRHDYDYRLVRKPALTNLMMECIWVKLPLMLAALEAGYEWVCYLDADTSISDRCPPVESLQEAGKSLFMANGFSGRVNAGVMIARNHEDCKVLLRTILCNFDKKLPPEDDVGWGDNGHVIHFSKHSPALCIIDERWNNNHTPQLEDYIRHYSAGPMRPLYVSSLKGRLYKAYSRLVNRLFKLGTKYQYHAHSFPERLYALYHGGASHNQDCFKIMPLNYFFDESLKESQHAHST